MARHDRDAALADLATGVGADNTLRMRLTAYVLAARLGVSWPSPMTDWARSGGRLLEHTDTRSGQGRSGLGLRVLDQWTGQARETSSLSGGRRSWPPWRSPSAWRMRSDPNSAAATSAPCSSMRLLAPSTTSLEDVMALLDGLQSGGRIVGIVSHVADLRARIPCTNSW